MRNVALALVLGLGVSQAAVAADFSKNAYGAVLGTYVLPDDSRDAKYGIGGSIVFYGKPIAEHLNVEFGGFGNTLRRDSDRGTDTQFGLGIDLLFPLIKGPISPFLLAACANS